MNYAAFRDQFKEAFDSRFYTIDWLDDLIKTGAAICLATHKAAIIITVRRYPTGLTELYGMYAAGDVGDIKQVLIPQAEQIGQSWGCTIATIESREAWRRLLPDYETYKVTMQKRL
jgi:hypothetical protein